MPVFDFKCPSCHHKLVDEFVHYYDDEIKCKRCGAVMKKLVSKGKFIGAKVFPADGIFLEHAGPDGKLFRSEKEMRDFEKTTGATIARLH